MQEVFLEAIKKLTEPVAIIAVVSMAVNVMFAINATRVLPKIYQILGKQQTLIEILVYGKKQAGGE